MRLPSSAAATGGQVSNIQGVSLAIIVPFRDQPEQNRGEQLRRFATALPPFLRSNAVAPALSDFHVFIIEQSQDGFKFNRGKTLNAGYIVAAHMDRLTRFPALQMAEARDGGSSSASASAAAASSDGQPRPSLQGRGFNAFCFHDVDLLPGPLLGPWYARYPVKPVHIGAVWRRYDYDNYVGGILTMSAEHVRATNAFPNNFWGWGGEDDELYSRLKEAGLLPPIRPNIPPQLEGQSIVDLEETIAREKGQGERAGTSLAQGGRTEWRNMWKHEMLALHADTWRSNGVVGCDFTVIGARAMGPHVTVVTVDLHSAKDPHAQKQVPTAPIAFDKKKLKK